MSAFIYLCKKIDSMGCKTIYTYAIATQNVDFTHRATIDSLGNYILNTAGIDAQGKGFGIDALAPQNRTWVISKLAIEIDSRPEQFSEFELATWVNQNSRLISTRNFELTDNSGVTFCRALSQWCMLDYVRRVPVNLEEIADLYNPYVCDDVSPCDLPKRLGAIEADVLKEHEVVYSDIDFNCHVNTMRYVGMMVDMLPIKYLEENRPIRIDIHFIRECRLGQRLKIAMKQVENSTLFEIIGEDGVAACRACFEWR